MLNRRDRRQYLQLLMSQSPSVAETKHSDLLGQGWRTIIKNLKIIAPRLKRDMHLSKQAKSPTILHYLEMISSFHTGKKIHLALLRKNMLPSKQPGKPSCTTWKGAHLLYLSIFSYFNFEASNSPLLSSTSIYPQAHRRIHL